MGVCRECGEVFEGVSWVRHFKVRHPDSQKLKNFLCAGRQVKKGETVKVVEPSVVGQATEVKEIKEKEVMEVGVAMDTYPSREPFLERLSSEETVEEPVRRVEVRQESPAPAAPVPVQSAPPVAPAPSYPSPAFPAPAPFPAPQYPYYSVPPQPPSGGLLSRLGNFKWAFLLALVLALVVVFLLSDRAGLESKVSVLNSSSLALESSVLSAQAALGSCSENLSSVSGRLGACNASVAVLENASVDLSACSEAKANLSAGLGVAAANLDSARQVCVLEKQMLSDSKDASLQQCVLLNSSYVALSDLHGRYAADFSANWTALNASWFGNYSNATAAYNSVVGNFSILGSRFARNACPHLLNLSCVGNTSFYYVVSNNNVSCSASNASGYSGLVC